MESKWSFGIGTRTGAGTGIKVGIIAEPTGTKNGTKNGTNNGTKNGTKKGIKFGISVELKWIYLIPKTSLNDYFSLKNLLNILEFMRTC